MIRVLIGAVGALFAEGVVSRSIRDDGTPFPSVTQLAIVALAAAGAVAIARKVKL